MMRRSSSQKIGGKTPALIALLLAMLVPVVSLRAQNAPGGYKLLREVPLPQVTGWDYLTIDPEMRRLLISDNSGAVVMDIDTDKVVGRVPDPPFTHGVGFVHGVAFARDLNRGFLSHEVPPSVITFNLQTLAQIGVTKTDPGTDAVIYDPTSKRVFTLNGKKAGVHNATVINAANGNSLATIALPGVPEFAAVDDAGHLYVNIESKSELAEIDTKSLKILNTWPLAPCQEPSALAMDVTHRRLFAGCDNKMLAMVDAGTGKVVATVAIGDGVDATEYDPATGYVFSSNGEGTLTIAHEDSPTQLTRIGDIKTQPGARTMALDTKTHRVFVLYAKFEPHRPAMKTPDNPHRYPSMVPGTARLLIFGQ
jgi:hypothetical protein